MELAQISANRWRDKENVVYMHTVGLYPTMKITEIVVFVGKGMELEIIMK